MSNRIASEISPAIRRSRLARAAGPFGVRRPPGWAPDHSSLDSLLERRGFELSVPSPETRNAENKGWRREQWSLTPLGPRVRIRLPPGMSPRTSGPSSEAVAASILHLLRNCPVLGAEVRTRDHATATPATSTAEQSLAPRRDGRADRWRADVSVACRRSRNNAASQRRQM